MKEINWTKSNYALIAILIFAAILRFYHLDYQSIWLDEIHTMLEANPKQSMSDVYVAISTGEQMPPLYFYSIYFLFKIFGYTTIVARVFSAVLGIISIFTIYQFGKELYSKQVGLIAALLLCLNPFHLFFSQEARPYIILLIFTILAFTALVKFVKKPNRKNAIFYGLFAGLMLSSHFFGLFVIVSQYFVLLVFLILSDKATRVSFFVNSFISGIVTLLLFIPAIKILIRVTEIKAFWIQPTTIETIKQIFKDFCGNSDFILTLSILALLYYLFIQVKEPKTKKTYSDIVSNKLFLSSIILFSWVLIVLAIPILRSYLTVPMIVSRYFIVILPALIVLISISIYRIKSNLIATLVVLLFSVGLLYQTIVNNNYYTSISKTQFREITQFIINNNTSNDPVVTTLGWHFSHFLANDKVMMTLKGKPLQDYVVEMEQDSTKVQSFWYVDAHGNPYKVKEQEQKFLDQKFIVEKSKDLFDCWTRHYVVKNKQNFPESSIVLTNLTDQNWIGGVGTNYNMLLLDFSAENEEKIKRASKVKFKDGRIANVVGYAKAGAYIQIQIAGSTKVYSEVASYPNIIEIINR
ncbi:glycosyltransferase family 39 protein [Flavobacterium sp. UBA7682]|uniref:glycosyltransferase family 39 protein n=1 Tax=Flavobacterium sp. UBA7682 TaxID=1946560 RepID=UPI0025BABC28|nr:glycosyltransferase family 39 protein [Flavobacterium sp. UBA7682]